LHGSNREPWLHDKEECKDLIKEVLQDYSGDADNNDEEFEEVLTDLEDELGISRGLDGAARQNRNVRAPDQIKEQIKYVTTAQDSLGRARTSVDEASRPVDTDALFDTHIGDVTRAQNHLEDAINELGNGDNSVQGLQSTLRDALGELRDYGDQLDERALKKIK
jgi:predicted component of type VI protein secretion system